MLRRVSVLLAFAGVLLPPASAGAVTLDPVGTFSDPVYVTSDPSDPDRLFVVEQAGRIQLLEGEAAQTTFLDIRDIVRSAADNPPESERGLLSMAFAPDFETSGHFYVFYTRAGTAAEQGDLQVTEFEADGDTANPATARPVLTIEHTQHSNHNGGQLQLGPDGYLYISTGDGGSGGDPDDNAQDQNELLGKVLRIDPAQNGTEPYSIPADNPFVGPDDGARDEIWSYGLRNPWRFTFDRLTGDLLIGDVGQGGQEEIDYEPDDPGTVLSNAGRGDNFGWDCFEGPDEYVQDPADVCADLEPDVFTEPVASYNHLQGRCSITGGYVVRDASLGDLVGRYLFVDLCAGVIVSVVPSLPIATSFRVEDVRTVSFPSSFGEDACGRVYIAELGTGVVSRFAGDEPADCGSPPLQRLNVTVDGDGEGSVSGDGIACPDDCIEDFDVETPVTLIATPVGDSTFAGWGGDCSGGGSCELTMSAARSVTATFDAPEPPPSKPPPACGREEATIEAEPGETVVGTPGTDVIVGSSGRDLIRGQGGNDVVCGLGGADRLRGGGGADTLKGGDGNDRLRGGPGSDHLRGGFGRNRCAGGPGRDTERSC